MKKKYGAIRNPITGGIIVMLITMIIAGMVLACYGKWIGIGFIGVGFAMTRFGMTPGSDEPFKLRLLKFWDNPINIDGRDVAVAGTCILADYPPFNLGSTQVDMTVKSMSFPVRVVSRNSIPSTGIVTIVAVPDAEHLFTYDKAGGWIGIQRDLELVVNRETETIARTLDLVAMAGSSALLSDQLGTLMPTKYAQQRRGGANQPGFQENILGFVILMVRAVIEIPGNLASQMVSVESARFESEARRMINDGTFNTVIDIMAKAQVAQTPLTFAQATEQVRLNNLLEQGNLVRAQVEVIADGGSGGGAHVTVADLHLNMGGRPINPGNQNPRQ